jgi:hypothetical protein
VLRGTKSHCNTQWNYMVMSPLDVNGYLLKSLCWTSRSASVALALICT